MDDLKQEIIAIASKKFKQWQDSIEICIDSDTIKTNLVQPIITEIYRHLVENYNIEKIQNDTRPD